jgi:hypothetical protein
MSTRRPDAPLDGYCRMLAMCSKHPKRRRSFISGLEGDKVAKEDERRSVEPGLVVCTFGVAWGDDLQLCQPVRDPGGPVTYM